jgi:hypothetical protein
VGKRKLSRAPLVVGFLEVELSDRAFLHGEIRTARLTTGRLEHDAREIDRLAVLEALLLGLDLLAFDLDLQARVVGPLLGEPIADLGAVDRREYRATLDRVAGFDRKRDRTALGRVQGRAHRGNDPALHGCVAHQIAAGDYGTAQLRTRHTGIRPGPAQDPRRGEGCDQHDRARHRTRNEPASAPRGRAVETHVLRRRICDPELSQCAPPTL